MLKKSLFLVLVISLFSTFVFGQAKNQSKQQFAGQRAKLNLTDEQKTKMEDFQLEMQKNQISERAKIQILQVEIKQIFSKEKFDLAEVKAKYEEIAKHEIAVKMNHLNFWKSVNDILSPDQQKVWKEMAKRMGNAKKMMKNRGMRNERMMQKRQQRGFVPPANTQPPPDAPVIKDKKTK